MTPERHKLAQAKLGLITSRLGLHTGSPMSTVRYEGYRDGYLRGFGDGVEHIMETSSSLQALETSLKLKDLRLDLITKENKSLNTRLEYRKKLHSDAIDELKIVIDMLTVIIGLKDPALLKRMQDIRSRLEISERG